jgi:hypothetical protein
MNAGGSGGQRGELANVDTATRYLPSAEPARLAPLLVGSVENLLASWEPRRALFPFSSRLEAAGVRNFYADPIAVRYTINSLLGLAEAARSGSFGVSEDEVADLAYSFLAREGRIVLPADHGLATILRCSVEASTASLKDSVRTLGALLRDTKPSALTMQDAAWILWGACEAAREGIPDAVDVASAAFAFIRSELVQPETGLPRHTTARYRRHLVSFVSLVYFLRSIHEAAVTLGDAHAMRLFERGVDNALALQGPDGEWPWMLDNRTGAIVDPYPLFTVHQDSMAMLFLHPAEDRGQVGSREAIDRSLEWVFGENELGRRMFSEKPFFAYRSIERDEGIARLRRYARSMRPRRTRSESWPFPARVRLNDECRSYHLGWLLYVWSRRVSHADLSAGP